MNISFLLCMTLVLETGSVAAGSGAGRSVVARFLCQSGLLQRELQASVGLRIRL